MNHIELYIYAYIQIVYQLCFISLLCAKYNILDTVLPASLDAM